MASSTPRPARRPRPSRATIIRRRVVALLILLALVALAAFVVTRLVQALTGAMSDEETPTPAAASSPTVVACDLDDVSLAASAADTVSGQEAEVTLRFTNAGGTPCLVETGRDHLDLTVTSGTDRVWDADVCGEIPRSRPLLLDAGSTAELRMTWDGTRSGTECERDRDAAAPGTYRYTVALDGVLGDTATGVVAPETDGPATDGTPAPGTTATPTDGADTVVEDDASTETEDEAGTETEGRDESTTPSASPTDRG